MSKRSGYLKAASRFLGLAAKAEDEEKRERAEDESEDDEEAREEEPKEEEGKKGKKAKKSKEPCSEEGEEEARADEEDGDGDDEDEKERKAAAKATADERARWAAVLSSAEAKGRAALACSLLADTDMSAEAIRKAILASPIEGASSGLAARMASVSRPDVGSSPAATPRPGTPSARVAEMKAAYDVALGR